MNARAVMPDPRLDEDGRAAVHLAAELVRIAAARRPGSQILREARTLLEDALEPRNAGHQALLLAKAHDYLACAPRCATDLGSLDVARDLVGNQLDRLCFGTGIPRDPSPLDSGAAEALDN